MKLRRRNPHFKKFSLIQKNYSTLNYDTLNEDKQTNKQNTINNNDKDKDVNLLKTKSNLIKINSLNHQQKSQKTKIKTTTKQTNKNLQSNKTLTTSQLNNQKSLLNVNSFKHLLSVPHIDFSNIKWTIGLRSHQIPNIIKRSISQVPTTYYKTTQTSKVNYISKSKLQVNHQISQLQKKINYNEFHHLTGYGQYPSMGTLRFQTTLRDTQERRRSPQLLKKQRQFQAIPLKDRHDYPKLLNSTSLKKKTINPQEDLVSAIDGQNNFPVYTDRIIKERNYNNIREMIKKPMRGKINLPALGWQTNLRFYENQQKNSQMKQK